MDGGPGGDGDFDLAFSLSAAKGVHGLQPEELGADVAAVLDISYFLPDIA